MSYRNPVDYRDLLLDAIEAVLARDLPDELFAEAVNDQARMLAGVNPDDPGESCLH